MNKIPALRIRHEHEIDLSDQIPDLSTGFTIEAWVRPAPMDRTARLYPEQGYEGKPARLKAGLYKNIDDDHLPQLGSVDLPEHVEIVYFSKSNFRDESTVVRQDMAQVPRYDTGIRSVVVIDRSHRRQHYVVIFEKTNYRGRAEVLTIPDCWQKPENNPADLHSAQADGSGHRIHLTQVGSAWVPPGVALHTFQQSADTPTTQNTLLGDMREFPAGITRIETRRTNSLPTDDGAKTVNTQPGNIGILTTVNGAGLALRRQRGELRGGPDELRFGGVLVRTNVWVHLAQTWDSSSKKMIWYVNGRKVHEDNIDGARFAKPWVLGRRLRGTIAQVRAWDQALAPEKVRHLRFPGVALAAVFPEYQDQQTDNSEYPAPPLPQDKFPQEISLYANLPVAVAVSAELPHEPAQTALVKHMQQQLDSESHQQKQAVRQAAAAHSASARRHAQRKLALAREQARRDIHLQGIKRLGFARGKDELYFSAQDGAGNINFRAISHLIYDNNAYQSTVDIVWASTQLANSEYSAIYVGDAGWNPSVIAYVSGPGIQLQVFRLELDKRLRALTCDDSGNNPRAAKDNVSRIALYWIEEDGAFYHAWDNGSSSYYTDVSGNPTTKQKLFSKTLPIGRPEIWALCVDAERQKLIWANGMELYRADLKAQEQNQSPDTVLDNIEILVPHVASPFPIAVATAPDGSLIWVDAEDEVVRMLPIDKIDNPEGAVETLYPAPNPSRGLAVCSLSDDQQSGNEAAFVYWVAALRRTLEVPVVDTPGRYMDLYHDPVRRNGYGNAVDIVAVNEVAGAQWKEARWRMPLRGMDNPPDKSANPAYDVTFGPFSSKSSEGFVLTAQLRIDSNSIQRNVEHALMTIVGFERDSYNRGKPIHVCVEGMRNAGLSQPYDSKIPLDKWVELRIECRYHSGSPFDVFIDGSSITSTHNSFYVGDVSNAEGVSVSLPATMLSSSGRITQVSGEVLDVSITSLQSPRRLLASRSAVSAEGKVSIGHHARRNILQLNPSSHGMQTSVLTCTEPEDFVGLEPIRINLQQGWGARAELIWEVTPNKPVCVYELATAEDLDRLVCTIDADGLPRLHLRWDDRLLTAEAGQVKSDKRVSIGERHLVTWSLNMNGHATTYIDNEAVWEQRLAWAGGIKVFESHRLGAPNTAQTHAHVTGALLNDRDDDKKLFTGFQGRIIRFAAFNSIAPKTTDNWSDLLGPDPSWARSLVTIESERRYLHAGRIDGKEPPVVLFPVDMDGGLSIETTLDQAHAEMTLAHARKAAVDSHAAHLQDVALQSAHDKIDAATQHLANTQAQSQVDISEAQDQAARDKAMARRQKADADAMAESKRITGKQNADQNKAAGKKHADDLKSKAASDKRGKIADAKRRLADKQDELQRKS